jgi:copper oxidase (laccase) domain-containing protein
MIATDQPRIFDTSLMVGVSSVHDGTMKFGTDTDQAVTANRRAFLSKLTINPAHTTLISITYDTDDFAKYRIVTEAEKSKGMNQPSNEYADALVTTKPNHALFLPLADCVGVVLYDTKQHVLMVSHLGRHSIEINGAAKSVAYLQRKCGTDPANLLVWLSPAVGKATYPLSAFAGKAMHEVIFEQLKSVGVLPNQIEASAVDTAQDPNYFSHSQYLKDSALPNGRFAIVAMMTTQGEPAV